MLFPHHCKPAYSIDHNTGDVYKLIDGLLVMSLSLFPVPWWLVGRAIPCAGDEFFKTQPVCLLKSLVI